MIRRLVYNYSIAFKRQVIEQMEAGRFSSINEAKEHYGIRGDNTIQLWLRKYGRNHLCPRIVRVEMPDEKDQIKQLKKQVKQLQQVLGRTQAEKVINEAFLEMACEKLGEDVGEFKKKADSLLSDRPGRQSQGQQ
jgi:transposase-like protein